jgi:hypothetical protein
LGVIGYSSSTAFDEREAQQILRALYGDVARSSNRSLIVVAGWLAAGVPLVAYREAVAMGLPTIGFAPQCAKQCRTFDCDEVHLVGVEWGDESAAFLSFIDGLSMCFYYRFCYVLELL